jgi:hypothetical protein
MLFALFIDTDSFEREVSTWSEMRLHGTREENRVGHFKKRHAIGDDIEFESYYPCHFNRSAECCN